jgi:hypothetical protein
MDHCVSRQDIIRRRECSENNVEIQSNVARESADDSRLIQVSYPSSQRVLACSERLNQWLRKYLRKYLEIEVVQSVCRKFDCAGTERERRM